MQERLQKILSARGIASRRKAEEYITAGLVKVNGKVATLGQKADPETDKIEVSGTVMQARQAMMYYVMYKPVGVVTTNIEGSRREREPSWQKGQRLSSPFALPASPSVRDLLPHDLQGRIYPVGRLDKDSEGLLLMTNDGVLAYRLTHPKFDHDKEYEVITEEQITEGQLMKLRKGMMILEEKTKPAVVRRIGPSQFTITLTEGKNRQIRRMVQKVGGAVLSLKRVRIMTLKDSQLKPGGLRKLTDAERTQLLASIGV